MSFTVIFFSYWIGAIAAVWATARATRAHAGNPRRRALLAGLVTVMFAPSPVAVGHGVLIPVPPWLATLSHHRLDDWLTWVLLPTSVTFVVLYLGGSVWTRIKRAAETGGDASTDESSERSIVESSRQSKGET